MLALAVRSAAAGRLLAQGTRRLVATRSSRLDNGAAQHEATDDGQPSHAHAAQPGGNERARPSAAELGRTRELLGQMLPPSARPAYTLDELVGSAYRLSATALQVCKLPAFLQLCAPRAAAASNWRQRWLLLEGPPRSELLQERLARALAHDLGAHFLMVRLDGLAAAASPAEQGGGRARGDGRANGNRAQVRKVAELARELEELTDELSDVMHDDGLAVADARIDATLAAAAAAAFQSHRRDGAAAAADAADAAEVQTALASLLEGAAPAAPAGPLVHELVLSLEADALQAEVRALRAVVAGARAPLLICLHGGHKVPVALRAVQRALRRVPRAPPLFVVGTATLTSVEPAGALDARGGGGGGDSGARGRRGGNASLRNMYATSVTLRPPAPTAVGAVVSGGSGGGGSGALGEHAGQAVGSGECAQRRWDKQLSADARAHTLATNLDGLRRALGALWPTARGGAVLSAALRGVGSAATDAVADVAAAPAAADGGGGVGNGGGGGGGGDGGVHALLSARELVPAELHRVAEWALADALMRAAGPERSAADLAGNPRGDRRPAERPSSQPPGAEDAPPSPRPPPRGGGGRGGARGGGAAAGGGAAGGLGALAIEAASVSAAVDVLICAQSEALLAALPAGSNGYGGGSGGGGGGGFSIGGQRGGGAELRATGAGGGGRGGGGGGGGKRCEYEVAIEKLVVPAEAVGVRFADVGALDEAKAALRELVSLPLQQPQLFAVGVSRHCTQGALLSGPPGTGKTMLAKAVATEAGAAFINISMAEITSKWYGEDEKHVAAIFRVARRLAPTVIFLDEIDSLLGRRGSAFEHEATRRLRNEFLSQWDGLLSASAQHRVLVLGATNRPFDLDEAALRRLPRRLALALPDTAAREAIFKVLLAHELGTPRGETLDLGHLARLTEGYSGSDLKHLCTTAALSPIRELLAAAGPAALERGATPLSADALRPLSHADFERARAVTKPSVSQQLDVTRELNKWHRTFAEGAGAQPVGNDALGF